MSNSNSNTSNNHNNKNNKNTNTKGNSINSTIDSSSHILKIVIILIKLNERH